MNRKKLFLKIIIAIIIVALGVSFALIGQYLYSKGTNMDGLLYTVLLEILLLFIIFIVNFILMKRFKNQRINTKNIEDKIFEKKKYAEENYLEYYNKIKKHIFISDIYFSFILFLLFSIYIILGLLFFTKVATVFVFVLAGFALYIAIIYLIGRDLPKDFNRNELKANDYPKLWDLINKVANKFDLKKNLKCYLTYDNNAGVIELDRNIEILLGIQLVYLMNEEELENILIHEFAHIHLNHTSRSIVINKRIKRWEILNEENKGIFKQFARILYYPLLSILYFEYEVFQMVSSRIKEDDADKFIIEKGNKQAHINALAKINIYNLFLYDEAYPVNEVYESEVITDLYYTIMYNKFIEYYNIHKNLWHELILKRMPARIESHYPFKYRMELLEVENFNVDFNLKIFENEKLINFASQLIKNDFKADYESQRKEHYLEPLKLIEEYDQSDVEFNNIKLFDLSYAYRKFGRLTDAIRIYDKLLEENSEHPKYMFAKGTALLSIYDNSGINLIYKAMELKKSFLNPGIEYISEYCLKMGLEEDMVTIREYLREHRDLVYNLQSKVEEVNLKDNFLPTTLDKAIIEEVVNHIIKDDRIERFYMADKIIENTYRMTIVGLTVKPNYVKQLEEILNNVFDYLDNVRREDFFLLSLNYYPAFYKKFQEIPFTLKYQNKENRL